MRADRVFAYGAALGFLGDLVAGDPRRGHPVAAFGRAAAALERRMWRDDRASGAVYAALCAGGAVAGAVLAERAVRSSPVLRAGLTAAATWSVLGGTSLAREARAVAAALEAGDLDAARARLPHLCGRDPQGLDEAGIARAVVESVAENTSDAVVGALVWGALGGVPGLVGFRAVNTLDAMVGHRSPRHLRFGWAAARLDDVVGYPGARLTAALAVLCGPSPRTALAVWRRDAAAHPSPNAGPVEAAFAGVLRRRLGGPLSYAGRTEHRAVLGPELPPPTAADIPRAIRLSRSVSALTLALCAVTTAAFPLPREGATPFPAPRRNPAAPDKPAQDALLAALSSPPHRRHARRRGAAVPGKPAPSTPAAELAAIFFPPRRPNARQRGAAVPNDRRPYGPTAVRAAALRLTCGAAS